MDKAMQDAAAHLKPAKSIQAAQCVVVLLPNGEWSFSGNPKEYVEEIKRRVMNNG